MTSLHPAITRAAALYDEVGDTGRLRDLEKHERAFLADVHEIRMMAARACGDARRYLGDNTPAFRASKFLIDQQHDADLTRLLKHYEAAIEAQDSELEYLLGVVAEEMEVQQAAE